MALLVILGGLPLAAAEECMNQENCLSYRPSIDVVFVIDSTGSMADEIRTVKTHLTKIIEEVEGGQPSPYLRVGVVSYRDHKPEEQRFLYRKLELTNDVKKAVQFIWGIEARGGGDLPEAVADGLNIAINNMGWEDALQNQQVSSSYQRKLIFLIGDAAPHGEGSSDNSFEQGCPNGYDYRRNIDDAKERGIRIYTVSGSGIDSVGVRIFKEIAGKTGGDYTYLSYVRRDVEQYYEEEGFRQDEIRAYAADARKDSDYDKGTNSILTNTLGLFAKSSIKSEAMEIGVEYSGPEDTAEENDDWVRADDITGDVVHKAETSRNSLYRFFKNIFDKAVFWK